MPGAGAYFASWSGCEAESGPSCVVRMTADRSIRATFASDVAGSFELVVEKTGTGRGTITGEDSTCDAGCTRAAVRLPRGTKVGLTATAAAGSALVGWSGCDVASGGSCGLALDEDRTVRVWFESLKPRGIAATALMSDL